MLAIQKPQQIYYFFFLILCCFFFIPTLFVILLITFFKIYFVPFVLHACTNTSVSLLIKSIQHAEDRLVAFLCFFFLFQLGQSNRSSIPLERTTFHSSKPCNSELYILLRSGYLSQQMWIGDVYMAVRKSCLPPR